MAVCAEPFKMVSTRGGYTVSWAYAGPFKMASTSGGYALSRACHLMMVITWLQGTGW